MITKKVLKQKKNLKPLMTSISSLNAASKKYKREKIEDLDLKHFRYRADFDNNIVEGLYNYVFRVFIEKSVYFLINFLLLFQHLAVQSLYKKYDLTFLFTFSHVVLGFFLYRALKQPSF